MERWQGISSTLPINVAIKNKFGFRDIMQMAGGGAVAPASLLSYL